MDERDSAVMAEPSADDRGEDIYGIARYLAEAVIGGEIAVEDAATALAEWADHAVRTQVAGHLAPGSEAERLMSAAFARHAA